MNETSRTETTEHLGRRVPDTPDVQELIKSLRLENFVGRKKYIGEILSVFCKDCGMETMPGCQCENDD